MPMYSLLTRRLKSQSICRLPVALPPNVKLVVSTLPDAHGILNSAKSLDIPSDNYVEVPALDESSAWTIIDKWLSMKYRKVQTMF